MRKNIFKKSKLLTKIRSVLSVYALTLCCLTACAGTDNNADPVKQTDPVSETDATPETENASGKIPIQETASSDTESETASDLPPNTSDAESTTESTEESSTAPEEPVINDTANMKDWELAYYEYIDTVDFESYTYSLIYVDNDDIPELVIDTGIEAGGCIILTWHENQLDDLQTFRRNFNYIERGNLVCNSDGNMGHYYNIVSTIQDGKWVCLFDGTYEDGANGPEFDDEGNFIYDYAINDESICMEDYMEKLNAVYPSEQAIRPEKDYFWIDILSVLKNGDVTSAGHRYELIIEDLSCTEAESACKAKGGYLATLTSFEEWDRVTAQITSEGKENTTFWVGTKYHKWLDPEIEGDYDVFDGYDIFFPFWAEGEPSYKMDEDYTVLFYNESDDRYYLNDVPDYLLNAAPSYTGKIGYICEYDE